MKTIITQESVIDDIPVTFVYDHQYTNICKIIFFYHGLSNHYFEGLELAHSLAHKGFFVVMPDAKCHGRRKSLDYFHQGQLKVLGGMYQIIGNAKQEFYTISQHLKHKYQLDVNSVGVCGYSMGGITSFYLASCLSEVSVCVPFIGLPSFVHEWETICKNQVDKYGFIDSGYADYIKSYLLTIDPFYRLQDYCPKPLLIINGTQDKSVSIKYSQIFFDHIKDFYQAHPDNLRFSKYDVDHRVTKEMIYEATDFFEKYL
ncbi:MAG: alpha/beta hydrolase [Candidatus Cloacimonetes bacterium]|nr:alpha/beta hydrolase [Candidatus Cloacimonadota bacterium]